MPDSSNVSSSAVVSAKYGPNPFPPTAVRRYESEASGQVSIRTNAMVEATAYVQEYIAATAAEVWTDSAHGNVMAILGDYGTGKTHLAMELAQQLTEAANTRFFYLDAPGDSFLYLYRDRFIGRLELKDVLGRVAEYYSDIVADELSESELTRDLAARLRNRKAEPAKVVERLGLPDATFRNALNVRLRAVTGKPDFGTALSLFLRPEFRDTVWDWLKGNEPDPVLVERGITRTIDSDVDALEALGVFALLYGSQRHRFVLIIDEMEKILSADSDRRLDGPAILAFKRLLEIVGRTGALLIVCGLQDFFEALPVDAQQRIPVVVRPTRLSTANTLSYIEKSLNRTETADALVPFSEDIAAYITDLAGGNARRVVRLCYLAFRAASTARIDVTRAMVRSVARDQFEVLRPEDVEDMVVRILDKNGWPRERDKAFGKGKGMQRADFWIPVQGATGCGLVLAQSVLQEADLTRLLQRAKAMTKKGADSAPGQTVLVVNGYIADSLEHALVSSYDRVVSYSPRAFAENLEGALQMCMRRLEVALKESELALILTRVNQVTLQASSISASLDDLLSVVTHTSTYEVATERALSRVFGRLNGREGRATSQYHRVDAVFREVDGVLDRMQATHEQALSSFFANAGDEQVRRRPEVPVARLGLASLLGDLVSAFREAVLNLLTGANRRSDVDWSVRLDRLCHRMDELVRSGSPEGLQDGLLEYWDAVEHLSERESSLPLERQSRDLETLRELGERVYFAAREDLGDS